MIGSQIPAEKTTAIPSMNKFTKLLREIKFTFAHINFPSAVQLVICRLLRIRRRIKTTITGESIWLRTCTPDAVVAVSILKRGEFSSLQVPQPVKTIVDGGGYIGASAIFFARTYPDAMIYAIEIEDDNFDLLKCNTAKYKNVKCIKAAVASKSGERTIRDRKTGDWGYTITETTNLNHDTGQKINGLTLDELMTQNHLTAIDLLKLDIEGAEKEVFESGGMWISNTKVIVVELHDRICAGCTAAFKKATENFQRFDSCGEKQIAYR